MKPSSNVGRFVGLLVTGLEDLATSIPAPSRTSPTERLPFLSRPFLVGCDPDGPHRHKVEEWMTQQVLSKPPRVLSDYMWLLASFTLLWLAFNWRAFQLEADRKPTADEASGAGISALPLLFLPFHSFSFIIVLCWSCAKWSKYDLDS
jgi:hypothetical protein